MSTAESNSGKTSLISDHQPYDFIAIEEADKMLEGERLRHEQELCKMKNLLQRQHLQILELDDGDASHIRLFDQEDPGTDGTGFVFCQDGGGSYQEFDRAPGDDAFSATIDEEEYKEQHERSHNAAECRTLEISLRQIEEENEDMKREFKDQKEAYQSYLEETGRTICDVRDRSDVIQHELKIEMSYFERAKAELEEILEVEQCKTRMLEEQLMLARREQEILEKAAVEAMHRQQEREEQEQHEEQERQQRLVQIQKEEQQRAQQLLQLEREEQERQQQQLQQKHHEELNELEKHQEQLNDVYFDMYNDDEDIDDSSDGSNYNCEPETTHQDQLHNAYFSNYNDESIDESADGNIHSNQEQLQREDSVVGAVNNGSTVSVHASRSHYSTRSKQYYYPRYDVTQERQQYHQQKFSVAVTTNAAAEPLKNLKRESRTNSHAHGIFMNFNDILV